MNDFINKIAPMVQEINQKRGKPLFNSVVIAQAILESGMGTSSLMMRANAIFGIKAFDDWKGKVYSARTKEVYNNNSIEIEGKFRAYDSLEESIEDYFKLICTSSRYRNAICSETPEECITEIIKGGYATDPKYVDKIMIIIRQNNLTFYDDNRVVKNYEIGKNYSTKVNLNVRESYGTNSRIKDFNKLTEDGKKHAFNQAKAVLKAGTTVTVLDKKVVNESEIWIRIPSGWIAGFYGGKYYVR